MENRPKRLLGQVRETLRRKHYPHRTKESYVHWIKLYILSHNKRHPREMGSAETRPLFSSSFSDCRPSSGLACWSHKMYNSVAF